MILGHRYFEQIYVEYFDRFLIVAKRYVRDGAVAEDLVMESFAAFWEARDRLPEDVNVPAYIMSSIKNRCLNWLSAEQLHLDRHNDMYEHNRRMVLSGIRSLNACNPDRLFAAEIKEIVRKELENMPEMTRKVFEASRMSDMTYAEIAAELGISQRQVTSHMQRALFLLRVALKDYLPFHLLLWYL